MSDAASVPSTFEHQNDSDFRNHHSNQPYASGQWENPNSKSGNLQNQPEQHSAPMSFHVADLIDSNSLPSWLRSAGEAEQAPPTNKPETSKPQSTLRPASSGAPNTDENYLAGRANNQAIAANSLVDQQSLPPWMQQEQTSTPPQENQRNISASSLIQPEAMPDWMKNMPAPTTLTAPSSSSPASRRGDIHDAQQLPTPTTDPFHAQAQSYAQPIPTTGQGFSAPDLIDQQSLPPWMKEQGRQESNSAPAGQNGPLSASSLIDKNMLPGWMREENQRPQSASAPLPPSPYTQPPQNQQATNATWQGQPTAYSAMPAQGNNAQPPSSAQHSISASSFIDINTLPPWLRQNDESQPAQIPLQPGQVGPQRPTYPVPPRAENMRVPSRPRSEMASNEGNEVAANVFASMLGVASTTPNFPPSVPQAYPGPQAAQGPQGYQSVQHPSSIPQQGMPPYGNMNTAQAPQAAGNMPPPQPAYIPGGYPAQGAHQSGYLGGNQSQGNYPMGNPPIMPPPNMGGQQPGMQNFAPNQYPQNMGNPALANEQQPNAKPAKRGLFEAIRNWLFRS